VAGPLGPAPAPAPPTPAPPAPSAHTYPVGVALGVFIGGFTSGPNQLADVYYPKGPAGATFPLVSFAHGIFSGGAATSALYSSLLARMASRGYVVVAIDVCGTVCDVAQYSADQRHVIDVVRGGGNSLFKLANTTRVGLAGHSYGAEATLLSGIARRGDVGAMWSMNPCQTPALTGKELRLDAPLALDTGTLDSVCDPYGVLAYYNQARAPSKFYFSLDGATHLEMENGYPQRFNKYVPEFFDCHLRGDPDACGRMYGGAGHNGVCKDLPMYECHKA